MRTSLGMSRRWAYQQAAVAVEGVAAIKKERERTKTAVKKTRSESALRNAQVKRKTAPEQESRAAILVLDEGLTHEQAAAGIRTRSRDCAVA